MAQTVLANRPWCKPSSKSGSDWTEDDLSAFKITFEGQDSATFFGVDPLPHPVNIPAAILTDLSRKMDTQDRETYRFLGLMEQAMSSATLETAVDDFSQNVFRLMRYDDPGFLVRSGVDLTFFMCGEERHAQTDVCVMNNDLILLIVQDDKRLANAANPQAQLVAEAIAAFHQNNILRDKMNLSMLNSTIMAGITMCGTSPVFYKIPITQDLVDCVRMGVEPSIDTKVLRHIPLFPDGIKEGMVPLGNRLVALKCYDAFKAFVFGDRTVDSEV
jgi:hypothetical protein